ncbi:MAG: caspase domain-containing protein [Pseudomonadota bacterium]|nr:caspase domain-containing protein [Pseudomonadota bacterium]
MNRLTKTLVIAALATVAAFGPASAEKRLALILGNSDYKNVATLKNPRNDATDISQKLRQLGFHVISGLDLDRRRMEEHIRLFAQELPTADVSLLYYAGHALQVNGENYLVPTEATLKRESDLDFEAVPLNLIMKQMQRTTRVSLVFLDACRDNPLTRSLSSVSRSLSVGTGLAAIEKASGMMIAFATEPGSVALDGKGRNSPFTTALLKHIDTPNATINDIMIEVRKDVMAATNNTQIPWENSSLTGRFYFQGSKIASSAAAPVASDAAPAKIDVADATIEHTFWTSIKDSNDTKLFQAYLDRFPSGVYTPIAEAKLRSSRSIAVEATDTPAAASTGTKVVSLDPAAGPAVAPEANPVQLAMLLQTELRRVGCYTGGIDGIWGGGSMSAVQRFNQSAGAALEAAHATQASIDAVAAQKGTVCFAQTAPQATRTVSRVHEAPPPQVVHRPAPAHSGFGGSSFSFGFSKKGGGGGSFSIGFGGGGFRF